MATVARLLTYEDLLETPDDGQHYQIIGGQLIVTPMPVPVHQEVCGRLGYAFYDFVVPQGLGKVYPSPPDVRLSPHDIVVPDSIYISAARRAIVESKLIDGALDLLVDVLSPSTRRLDLGDKADLYARSGVREYWWVDPSARSNSVRVFETGEETTVLGTGVARSTILPGFEVDVEALFSNLW